MTVSTIGALEQTVHLTQQWLHELAERGGFDNEEQAYSAFRAVLHALRDRLTVDEACHLAAQMPMLVRGFYFEGWKPAMAPNKERTVAAFLVHVQSSLGRNTTIEPAHASRAVFEFLEAKVDAGEIQDVRHMLPEKIREELWP